MILTILPEGLLPSLFLLQPVNPRSCPLLSMEAKKKISVWSDACHVLMCCGVAFLLHCHLCSTRFNMLHVRCLGCRQMCRMSFGSSVRGFCSLGHIVVTCKKVCKNIPIKFSAHLVQCWLEFVALTSAMPCPRVQPASFIKSCQMYTIFVSFQPISHHYIMSFKWPAEHMWGQTIHPQLSGQFFLPHPVHSRRGMLGDGFPSQLRQLGIQVYHTTHLFLGNQWPKFPVTARVSGSIWCWLFSGDLGMNFSGTSDIFPSGEGFSWWTVTLESCWDFWKWIATGALRSSRRHLHLYHANTAPAQA